LRTRSKTKTKQETEFQSNNKQHTPTTNVLIQTCLSPAGDKQRKENSLGTHQQRYKKILSFAIFFFLDYPSVLKRLFFPRKRLAAATVEFTERKQQQKNFETHQLSATHNLPHRAQQHSFGRELT